MKTMISMLPESPVTVPSATLAQAKPSGPGNKDSFQSMVKRRSTIATGGKRVCAKSSQRDTARSKRMDVAASAEILMASHLTETNMVGAPPHHSHQGEKRAATATRTPSDILGVSSARPAISSLSAMKTGSDVVGKPGAVAPSNPIVSVGSTRSEAADGARDERRIGTPFASIPTGSKPNATGHTVQNVEPSTRQTRLRVSVEGRSDGAPAMPSQSPTLIDETIQSPGLRAAPPSLRAAVLGMSVGVPKMRSQSSTLATDPKHVVEGEASRMHAGRNSPDWSRRPTAHSALGTVTVTHRPTKVRGVVARLATKSSVTGTAAAHDPVSSATMAGVSQANTDGSIRDRPEPGSLPESAKSEAPSAQTITAGWKIEPTHVENNDGVRQSTWNIKPPLSRAAPMKMELTQQGPTLKANLTVGPAGMGYLDVVSTALPHHAVHLPKGVATLQFTVTTQGGSAGSQGDPHPQSQQFAGTETGAISNMRSTSRSGATATPAGWSSLDYRA